MSGLFTITSNGKPLEPGDGTFETDSTGWSHSKWVYCIAGKESGESFDGEFRAGIALRYESREDLGDAILESLAGDVATATDYWCAEPCIRDSIAYLAAELGEDDPVRAYDTALQLVRLGAWYWSLSDSEQQELQDIAESED